MNARRIAASVAALVLGLSLVVPVAVAEDHSPWVPPGQVDTSGHADVAPVLVGSPVPGISSVPPDTITRATVGRYCAVHIGSLVWTPDHVLTVTTASEGGSWCTPPMSLSSSWAIASAACIEPSTGTGNWNGEVVGGTTDGGATYVYGGVAVCEGGTTYPVCFSWQLQEPEWSGHWDGFVSCDPNRESDVLVTVTCSDGSVHTDRVPAGTLPVPVCPAGTYTTGVVVSSPTGVTIGSAATHEGFPDVCRSGACIPHALVGGQWCAAGTMGCSGWWAGSAAADGCAWSPPGVADPSMWYGLLATDCEQARSHGYFPIATEPTATASSGPTTINVNVNVTVKPTVQVTVNVDHVNIETDPNPAGCLAGVDALNAFSWVIEPLRCLLIPSDAFIAGMGLSVADPPPSGSGPANPCNGTGAVDVCPAADSQVGKWKKSLEDAAAAFRVPPRGEIDCLGPGLVMPPPSNTTIYPAQACSDPGKTLASMSYVGTAALIGVVGFLSGTKILSSLLKVHVFQAPGAAD